MVAAGAAAAAGAGASEPPVAVSSLGFAGFRARDLAGSIEYFVVTRV